MSKLWSANEIDELESKVLKISGQFSWANLPSPAPYSGYVVFVPDIGISGSFWRSNGSQWAPVDGAIVLAKGASPLTLTGTAVRTNMVTVPIAAGLMGLNGVLRFSFKASFINNSGTGAYCDFLLDTGLLYHASFGTTDLAAVGFGSIENRNSQSSQLGGGLNWNGGTNAQSGFQATAIDTSIAQNLYIALRLNSAVSTATLESYLVELVR